MKQRVQFYVNEGKEPKSYQFIKELENMGISRSDDGKVPHGWMQERLREWVTVFHMIAEQEGTMDPYEIYRRYTSREAKSATIEPVAAVKNEEKRITKEKEEIPEIKNKSNVHKMLSQFE